MNPMNFVKPDQMTDEQLNEFGQRAKLMGMGEPTSTINRGGVLTIPGISGGDNEDNGSAFRIDPSMVAKAEQFTSKMGQEWAKLTEEEKQATIAEYKFEWPSAMAWAGAVVTSLDAFLPIPGSVFMGLINQVAPELAQEMLSELEKNPKLAATAQGVGMLIGAIVVPGMAGARGAALMRKLMKFSNTGKAARLTIKSLNKLFSQWSGKVSKVNKARLKKAGLTMPTTTRAYNKVKDEINFFAQKVGDSNKLFGRFSDKSITNINNIIRDLPADNFVKKYIGKHGDIGKNWLNTYFPTPREGGQFWKGFIDAGSKAVHTVKYNKVRAILETLGATAGAAVGDFWLSFVYWQDRGYTAAEAMEIGVAYTMERTWKEAVAEGATVFLGGPQGRAIEALLRLGFLAPDLNDDLMVMLDSMETEVEQRDDDTAGSLWEFDNKPGDWENNPDPSEFASVPITAGSGEGIVMNRGGSVVRKGIMKRFNQR